LTGDFMRLLAVATWALLPAVALAQAAPSLSLSLPVACALGSECVLQNYPDAEELRLLGPDGSVPVERRSPVERDLAQWYTYVGVWFPSPVKSPCRAGQASGRRPTPQVTNPGRCAMMESATIRGAEPC
jgi:hypothetical protein